MMPPQRRPDALAGLSDDQLGTVAVSVVVAELQWTPDVAPAVLDRIARDAVAYPEQLDRRIPPQDRAASPGAVSSTARTISRIAVIAVIILLVASLVVVAATADAAVARAATVLSTVLEAG